MDDAQLLRRYAETADQAAFATLVERRLPLVYSAALRQVGGDAHLARDVAQSVFADLARKAEALAGRPVLAGWLYTSACYAAAKIVRAEQRRRRREQEATAMDELTRSDAPPADWAALRGVIDAAMRELKERDREAVLLRFFENRGFAEIGERLRLGENGARMRVERALDKLHAALARRGIRSSAAALGAVLAAEAVAAAPGGLASAIAAAAPAASAAGGAAGLLMSVTKLQWAAGAVVLAAGVLTGVVQQRANAALERDVAGLRAVADEIDAEHRRLRAPSAGSDERERLRAEADELPELQRRLRMRSDEWRKWQEASAAAKPRRAPAPPRADEATRPAELDALPRPVAQAAPSYPAALREFGIAGRATMSFVVDASGDVVGARVVSSTHSAFDEPALEALRQWKFAPGRKGGRPVNTRLETAIVFTLQHEGDDWF